jgi:hypothetical protein
MVPQEAELEAEPTSIPGGNATWTLKGSQLDFLGAQKKRRWNWLDLRHRESSKKTQLLVESLGLGEGGRGQGPSLPTIFNSGHE